MASQQTWSVSTLNISVYLIILSHLFRVPSLLDQLFLFGDKFFYYHFPLLEASYIVPDENLVILGFAEVSSFSKTVLILNLTFGLLKVAVLYISSPLSSIQRSICLTFLASTGSYSGLFKISSQFLFKLFEYFVNVSWTYPVQLWRCKFVCHSHMLLFVKYKEQVLFIDTRVQYHNVCVL